VFEGDLGFRRRVVEGHPGDDAGSTGQRDGHPRPHIDPTAAQLALARRGHRAGPARRRPGRRGELQYQAPAVDHDVGRGVHDAEGDVAGERAVGLVEGLVPR
jgi:hypothetical protein